MKVGQEAVRAAYIYTQTAGSDFALHHRLAPFSLSHSRGRRREESKISNGVGIPGGMQAFERR